MTELRIEELHKSDIKKAIDLWVWQYECYSSGNAAYQKQWLYETQDIERELSSMCEAGHAFAAVEDGKIAGYLGFWEFPFHGENSVFCPVFAHAAEEERKESIYLALYKHASEVWVSKGIFNHMLTFHIGDERLKSLLYDLGFGSYVADAFCIPRKSQEDSNIKRSSLADVDTLYGLVRESKDYYKAAPVFLKCGATEKEDLERLMENGAVFIAYVNGEAAGFMNARILEENDPATLAWRGMTMIDEIGAYIKPEYRARGLGGRLLNGVQNYCAQNGIEYIHVDFETANPYANRFWRKHFKPVLLSVRRTVNKDINS